MKFGIDRLLVDPALRRPLEGKRVALVAHPASVTENLAHSLDALIAAGVNVTSAFGPQHGLKGDKQDNMVETADELDPVYNIPVFSLYGEVRRPSGQMMSTADVFLFDLQDLGCRIYTFVTTLLYLLEAAHGTGKEVWVLDRPNPAGRPVEGSLLEAGWESFVGAAPLIMRHGLTFGELAQWLVDTERLDVDLQVVPMTGYRPDSAPGYGWPLGEYAWVNPSPNASSLNMARCFPGTVLFEGATLSEGRGTTTALEIFGAPDIQAERLLQRMAALQPAWLEGSTLRPCYFEPTFHKHAGKLCSGIQIHTDNGFYRHERFRPYRLVCLLFKALRLDYPDYPLWRQFAYEYEHERLAIDLLSGGPRLREWVDDPQATPGDLERWLTADEALWAEQRAAYLRYA